MKKICFVLLVAVQVVLIPGLSTSMTDKKNASELDSGRGFIEYENSQITAEINQAPLGNVVKVIEAQTGARFTLKDPTIVNYPLSVKIEEATLEEALKRIFKHYSYVAYYNSAGMVNKVVIFGAKASAARGPARSVGQLQSQSAGSETSSKSQSASAETIIIEAKQTDDDTGVSAAGRQKDAEGQAAEDLDDADNDIPTEEANIPYDLDEYQSLPETVSDTGLYNDSSADGMEDPESMRLAAEEQRARQEAVTQAKLERSLSALNSEHAHLRSMAVDELVSLKDPRATSALAGAANSKDLAPNERRRVAEALWHHAADLEFANPAANEALQQMASDDDPAVREVARRALTDMERYTIRNNQ